MLTVEQLFIIEYKIRMSGLVPTSGGFFRKKTQADKKCQTYVTSTSHVKCLFLLKKKLITIINLYKQNKNIYKTVPTQKL